MVSTRDRPTAQNCGGCCQAISCRPFVYPERHRSNEPICRSISLFKHRIYPKTASHFSLARSFGSVRCSGKKKPRRRTVGALRSLTGDDLRPGPRHDALRLWIVRGHGEELLQRRLVRIDRRIVEDLLVDELLGGLVAV